jgi:hypothetical protein
MHPIYAVRDDIGIENLRKLDASKIELPQTNYQKYRERPLWLEGRYLRSRLNSVGSGPR